MDKSSNILFFPFNYLSNTSQNKVTYLLNAVAISTIPALGISYLIYAFFPEAESPRFPEGIAALFLSVVILAPVVETLILWLGITIIKKFTSSIWIATLLSAFLWALVHSLGTFAHGFAIFWSFVVFSFVFIIWYEKSRDLALSMCAAIHMGQNLVAFLLMQIL